MRSVADGPRLEQLAASRLLALAAQRLRERGVRCALIGGAAVAAHGVAREFRGLELLVVSRAVLEDGFWQGLEGVKAQARSGGPEDQHAGEIALALGGDLVSVKVGKMAWQQDLLLRARPRLIGGTEVPVASVVDLILLELCAGGAEDVSDIGRLLAITDRESITELVDARLNQLPPECARIWRKVLAESS